MSYHLKSAISIDDYLKRTYPSEFTVKEICDALHMSDCTAQRSIKTLLARGSIELVGKRGKSNIYRYKQN